MPSLLRSLVVLVPAFGAVESFLVRLDLPHRPVEARLFLQAALLWLVFGLLALGPAWITLRVLRRGPRDDAEHGENWSPLPALVLLAWMAAPVLAHGVIDRYTGLSGSMAALASLRPWLEVAGVFAALGVALVGVAFGAAKLGASLRPGAVAAAVFASSLVVGLFLPWRFGSSPDPAGSDAPDARPNLLLLVWDTMRVDRLTPYGYGRETTPHLAKLAEEAIVFEEARSVSCFTFTSHLSMLTGVHPSSHGARLLDMRYHPVRAPSIADVLRRAGYRTGGFVGTDVLAGRTGIRYGFEEYDDRVDPPVCDTRAWKLVHDVQSVLAQKVPALRHNGLPHWIQDFQRPASEVLGAALAWIEEDDPRPWFCMVNLYDAHWPYVPTGPGRAALVRDYDGPLDGYLFRSDAWRKGYEMGEEDARHVSDLYDAEVYDLDLAVDAFLSRLGLDDGKTALLMTSDHGEAFGEAGRWKHEDITEPQVRVPLLVRRAGTHPAGARRTVRASGVDVAPTLLGLAGLTPPPETEGVDLLAEGTPEDRDILIEDRDQLSPTHVRVALYRGPWKLVRSGLGEEVTFALFDLDRDPIGETDVSAAHPEVLAALTQALEDRRRRADLEDAAGVEGGGGPIDALRGLGYAGGGNDPDEEAPPETPPKAPRDEVPGG